MCLQTVMQVRLAMREKISRMQEIVNEQTQGEFGAGHTGSLGAGTGGGGGGGVYISEVCFRGRARDFLGMGGCLSSASWPGPRRWNDVVGWDLLGAEASGITRRRYDVRRMRSSVCASSLVWCATSKSRWTKHRPTLSRQVAVSVPRAGPRPLPFVSAPAQPHLCCVAWFGSVLPDSLAGSQAKSKGEAEPDELMDLQDTVYPAA